MADDGASIALDGGTREKDHHEAVAITSAFGKRLREGTIAYKKVDSLMIMDALAAGHDAAVQMIDTSIVRVHQHGASSRTTIASIWGAREGA